MRKKLFTLIFLFMLAASTGCISEDSGPRPYIAITFDDGINTDYTVAFPLMEERGIKGTTYVITERIGVGHSLSWEQIKALKDAGWEIGCHTHTHARLTELTKEEIIKQMKAVDNAFETKGLSPPKHHAYPFGLFDCSVVETVKDYRKTARSAYFNKSHESSSIDLYRMQAAQAYLHSKEDLKSLIQIIDYTVDNNLILIIFTHDVRENAGQYGAEPLYFEKLLDYIVEKQVKTGTIQDVYEYIKTQ